MGLSTITLQSTLNFASTFAELLPLANVGGFTNEPGLTICNDAVSDIICDPNDWVFNRNEMNPLFSCPNKQDYLFAGASVFALSVSPNGTQQASPSMGWAVGLASDSAVTVSGGVVTLNTLEAHRFAVGQTVYPYGLVAKSGNAADATKYNATFTDNGSVSQWNGGFVLTAVGASSISWAAATGQNNGDILGAAGITNFGYGTSATFQEVNNNSSPPNVQPCTVYRELPVISRVANPNAVAVIADLGTGVLKIRLHMVPSNTVWQCNIVYQGKPPLYSDLTDTWGIPDSYRAIINQAVLYRMYLYIDDLPKSESAYQKLKIEIAKIHGADNASPTDVHIQPSEPIMDNSYWGWW